MEKISTFQVVGIQMSGFKFFSAPTDMTFGSQTIITGGNGRGKSSLADAIAFAITGLPFFGERQIDQLHSDDNPDLFLRLRLVDGDEVTHELTRTRKGSRMTITYDGREIRQMDLTEMFGERDVFLSIFNPLYFIEELGNSGKNLLQRYLPTIPQEAVLAQLSEHTREALTGENLLSPEGRVKCLREEVRELERTVIYLQGKQDFAVSQREQGTQTEQELAFRLAALCQEQEALTQKRFSGMDISAMQDRLVELSARYSDLSSESLENSSTTDLEKRIAELNRQLGERQAAIYAPKYTKAVAEKTELVNTMAVRYRQETGILNRIAKERRCPTCRRTVTDADIPVIKAAFEKTIGEIVADGKEQRAQLNELQGLEQKAQETFEQFKQEDISRLERELHKAEQARDSAAAAANEAARQKANQREQLRAEIQTLTSDLECGRLSPEEFERLKICDEEILQVKADLSALQKTACENFEDKIKAAKAEICAKKEQIDSLLVYLSKRAELTFEQLHMNRVAISLYDVVKSTGELKDTFQFTYNGRRYDRLSLSEKVRAGMEVSELMKKLTGRNYPVFVDNMESVDDLANVRPTGQVIMARCVRNAALDIQVLKPAAPQLRRVA
jgi:DNA repair exonuclease SbcCD ATPase subunit